MQLFMPLSFCAVDFATNIETVCCQLLS